MASDIINYEELQTTGAWQWTVASMVNNKQCSKVEIFRRSWSRRRRLPQFNAIFPFQRYIQNFHEDQISIFTWSC